MGWVGGPAWDGPAQRRPPSLRAARVGFALGTVLPVQEAAGNAVRANAARWGVRVPPGGRARVVVTPVDTGRRTGGVVEGALRSVGRRRAVPPWWRLRWSGSRRPTRRCLRSARAAGCGPTDSRADLTSGTKWVRWPILERAAAAGLLLGRSPAQPTTRRAYPILFTERWIEAWACPMARQRPFGRQRRAGAWTPGACCVPGARGECVTSGGADTLLSPSSFLSQLCQ